MRKSGTSRSSSNTTVRRDRGGASPRPGAVGRRSPASRRPGSSRRPEGSRRVTGSRRVSGSARGVLVATGVSSGAGSRSCSPSRSCARRPSPPPVRASSRSSRRRSRRVGRPPSKPAAMTVHPHLVAQLVVDHRTEDDVGVGVRRVGDQRGRLVDLEQAHVRAAGDGQQHTVRPVDTGLQQRAGDGGLRGTGGPLLAAGGPDAHERAARVAHHRLHVGEVQVDETGGRDEVGDALHAGQQDLVGAS